MPKFFGSDLTALGKILQRETPVMAQWVSLPFYPRTRLVRIEMADGALDALLVGDLKHEACLYKLEGFEDSIFAANAAGGISLNRENICDYVRFFCGYSTLSSDEPFELVDVAFDEEATQTTERFLGECFCCEGSVRIEGLLVDARFDIDPDGDVIWEHG